VSAKQLQESINSLLPKIHNVYVRQELYRVIGYNRDIVDGKGERKVTYMLLWAVIAMGYGDEALEMLKLFANVGYGYWGDFVSLYQYLEEAETVHYPAVEALERKEMMKRAIINTLVYQIRNDERLLIQSENKRGTLPLPTDAPLGLAGVKPSPRLSLSLLAKWIPSEGKQKDSMAKEIAFTMFPRKYDQANGAVIESSVKKSLTKYRNLIAKIRSHLNLVESKMSANQWGDIEPSAIPAKTMKKHRKVFMNKKGSVDVGRVLLAEKLTLLLSGKTDKTIKTKGLQFYELIKPYVDGSSYDEVIEVQAKTIIKDMQALVKDGSFPLSVALCDVSGSMSGIPLIVSVALGIILANIMPAPWNGKVITFETKPRWVDIEPQTSIYNQVRVLKEAPWGGSTNFAAAVDLVLKQALASKEPKKSIPEFFFCFTDMQFNEASVRNTFVIDDIKKKFQYHGLVMPKLILWNLRASGTNTFAADKSTTGVGLLSGFSQSTFKTFMSGCNFDLMTPIYLLKETLHVPRYDAIANCAKAEK
jgi:hypothetical protein